jgi:radical SAM protein with 4Fe4S-binding SPASM domain
VAAEPRRGLREWLHPLYRSLETSVHPLRYLFLEITQRCNLACRHCGSDCGTETRHDELTTDEWLAFLAGLPRRFDRRKLVLVITGGEPLCHPELPRLLAALRQHELRWGMVTNGWAASERRVGQLVGSGMTAVTVSLDGLGATHDWLRGRSGSYERALAAIDRFARSRIPFFDVVTCVHPGNLGELEGIAELLHAHGVAAWRLFTIFPKGRAKDDPALHLSAAQQRELMAFVADARKRWPARGLEVQYSCEGYMPPALDRTVRGEPYFCRAGISIGSVLCDGAVSACPNVSRDLVQGNIRAHDLATLWEERFTPFRERSWLRTGPCVECDDWRRCQGNSLHLWDPARAAPHCTRDVLCGDR